MKINIWKTLYFNFRYFPLKTAVRLPFLIYRRSELYKLKGRIIIDGPVKTGMVKFGVHGLGTQDLLYSRTMLALWGTLIVKGKTRIGRGSKISVGGNATLTLGEGFNITGDSEIICEKAITFGRQCLLSWNILLMDTDYHHILDDDGQSINPPKPITIGNNVWIGCRTTILKGVSLPDNTVVAATSTITRSVAESNCIVAGHGKSIEILRRNVSWKE